MPISLPGEPFTFRVKLIDRTALLSQRLPDSNMDNILTQLAVATVNVPGVPHPLKDGDVFTLYGPDGIRARAYTTGTGAFLEEIASTGPTADFTPSSTSGATPLAVTFTDASTGTPTEWYWSFETTRVESNEKSPTHTFASAGTYPVSLVVSSPTGTDKKTQTISVADTPSAAFVGTPTTGTYPLTVTFTDQTTGTPTSWAWTFGDSGTSTVQNPTHTYTSNGVRNVSLVATNVGGSSTVTQTGYVTVAVPLSASFTATGTTGTHPLTTTFTDTSTGTPTSWAWTFGDSGTSTVQNPTHTYANAGTYTVRMVATNAFGSSTVTKNGFVVAS